CCCPWRTYWHWKNNRTCRAPSTNTPTGGVVTPVTPPRCSTIWTAPAGCNAWLKHAARYGENDRDETAQCHPEVAVPPRLHPRPRHRAGPLLRQPGHQPHLCLAAAHRPPRVDARL